MDTTIERNGQVTRYGLGCGYVESWGKDGRIRDYYLTDENATRLSFNGTTYDVHTRIAGVTHDADGFPIRIDGSRADWEQFETLTEARRAVKRNRKRL